eukprot:TRINITY_DN2691_c0_g1::TRINITY_DN2691_c0_g1_i1::g.26270::m.26270 TRINITY_DN2691_c0_g1::TRINITY_DN2691_c0_g1_i1::g.26270  ORF type:complete len:655 (+),score=151.47,sp/Q9NGP5/ABCG2_DICDI/21.57/4e-24,sp/Q9NGP5/ABCG2_DICDI/21.03/4e-14,ABC2_membrane/PF01061.19/6.3e-19,ABC2_membrane/PF01061.19/3.8e+02,ABC_tran/PF00005.22/3e-06,TMEM220/PF15071.1/4.8e+02,TMEM220/PF15071.1/2 TRINITY_DN2691_c0_g1_i1:2-1966(+)
MVQDINAPTLHLRNVTFSLENLDSIDKVGRTVHLDNVTTFAPAKAITAFVLGSDAQTTPIAELLYGECRPDTGVLKVDDVELADLPHRKRRVAFLDKRDPLFNTQTVREAITMSLQLRGTPNPSLNDVTRIMELFHIDHLHDHYIGQVDNPTSVHRVSIEERRLVSIALEFAWRPLVLVADDPLFNLAPIGALRIMNALRAVASTGTTVVIVLQEPSSKAMLKCDRLVVIQGGSQLYQGTPTDTVEFFSDVYKTHHTPTDNADKNQANSSSSGPLGLSELIAFGRKHPEAGFKACTSQSFINHTVSDADGSVAGSRGSLTNLPEPYQPSVLREMWIVFVLTFFSQIRTFTVLRSRFFSQVLMGLVQGSLINEMKHDQNGANGRWSIMVFVCPHAVGCVTPMVFIYISSFPAYYRAIRTGLMRPAVYYLARILSEGFVVALSSIVFTCAFYPACDAERDDNRMVIFAVAMWVMFMTSSAMGAVFAAIFNHAQVATTLYATLNAILYTTASVIVKKSCLRGPLYNALYYANYMRYCVSFLAWNTLHDIEYSCPDGEGATAVIVTDEPVELCMIQNPKHPEYCVKYYCPTETDQDLYSDWGISEEHGWMFAAMVMWMLFYQLCAFAVMVRRKKFGAWPRALARFSNSYDDMHEESVY